MKYVNGETERKLVEAHWKGDSNRIEQNTDDMYQMTRYEIYRLSQDQFIDLFTKADVNPEEAAAWLVEYTDSDSLEDDELLSDTLHKHEFDGVTY